MEKDNLYYFVKVFKEYDQLPNQSKTDEILETYWKKVNNLQLLDVRYFYVAIRCIYKCEKKLLRAYKILKKANEYIDHCINDSLSIEPVLSEDYMRFCMVDNNVKAQLFFIGAEVCAKLKKFEESNAYYCKYHFWNNQTAIPKTLKKTDKAVVYSFRKYNEYSLSDLVNSQITCCSPSLMNDPLDSLINVWASKNNLNRFCNEKMHIDPFVESFKGYRIRCFSASKSFTKNDRIVKNILMWSHYADEHKGFCVRYRLSSRFIKYSSMVDVNFCALKPISYKKVAMLKDNEKINTRLAFETKAKCWEYEHEVRLIDYNSQKGKYRSISLDEDSVIEEIIFGCRCPEETIKTIIKLTSALSYGASILFSKMEFDENGNIYSLKKKQI